MKRLLAILMISFILANVAGFYVYFVFRLKEIRKEMRASLKDYPIEKLQRLALTKAQYQVAKNDEGEIEWQGYMYDVGRVETRGSEVTVFALRDEAETNLLAFIDRIVEMTNRDNQSPPSVFTQFLSLIFTIPEIAPTASFYQSLKFEYGKLPIEIFSSLALDVQAPPPRA
jgi:hypothetical protein